MDTDELTVTTHAPQVLGVGARLRVGTVVECVGRNVTGPVYRVLDELGSPIAVREYLPSALATRQDGVVRPQPLREAGFEAGRKRFEEDGEELAALDHPGLLKVQQIWSENGTAYQAMPWYEGRLLGDVVRAASVPPSEALLCDWLRAIADALTPIHRQRGLHGHLSPWQVMRLDSGRLMVMEFSRARRFLARDPRDIDRDPFAALECGGDARFGPMGPWTDIYAMAAILYFALRGRPPQTPVRRAEDDTLDALSECIVGGYDPALLHGIDCGLAVRPRSRPRDLPTFMARVGLHERRARARSSGESLLVNLHLSDPGAWPDRPDETRAASEKATAPMDAMPWPMEPVDEPGADPEPTAATASADQAKPSEAEDEAPWPVVDEPPKTQAASPPAGPDAMPKTPVREARSAERVSRVFGLLAWLGAAAALVGGGLWLHDMHGHDEPWMNLAIPAPSPGSPGASGATADTRPSPVATASPAASAAAEAETGASSPIPDPLEPTAAGPTIAAPDNAAAADSSGAASDGRPADGSASSRTPAASAVAEPGRPSSLRSATKPAAEPLDPPTTASQDRGDRAGEAPTATSPCPDLLARQYIGRPLDDAERRQLSALCR